MKSEYVVQKKTECTKCQDGIRIFHRGPDQTDIFTFRCDCTNGYIYEEVPLLEALRDLIVSGAINERLLKHAATWQELAHIP